MGYILLMTLAGSALFLGYLLCEKMLGKSMTQCMRYGALMIVMLNYAIPWVWIKGIYRSVIEFFWSDTIATGTMGIINLAEIETTETAYQTKEYGLLTLAVSIWFVIALTLLIIRIVRYLTKRHALHALAIECEDENLEHTLKCLRETLGYQRRIEIAWTRVDNETFTLGAIKPIIFLQKEYGEGELYWILKHEMTHIAKMDLLVKLLLEFVCSLYWFNPLIYLLEHKMKYLCETSCDEKVIKGCTEEECQKYIDLLDRNKRANRPKIPLSSALEDGGEIDKRITLIKNRKDIKHREKVIVICLFGAMIFLNSLTALAYPKVHHVKSETVNVAVDSIDGNNFWIYEYAEDGFDMPNEVILYDEQFIDENGQIYPIDSAKEQDACPEHDFESGVIQIHIKNEDGGCAIETYEGARCTKCGIGQIGKRLYKVEKISCPH